MKNSTYSKPSVGTELLFSMILFLVFSLCSIFTVLIGSRVYENIHVRNERTYHRDTALAYLTNKVRQADQAGSVSIASEDGIPVLLLTTEEGGFFYETWIYTSGGVLKELYTEPGSGLGTADGLAVMDCAPLTFSLESPAPGRELLTVTLGGADSARILLRSSGKGGADQ